MLINSFYNNTQTFLIEIMKIALGLNLVCYISRLTYTVNIYKVGKNMKVLASKAVNANVFPFEQNKQLSCLYYQDSSTS